MAKKKNRFKFLFKFLLKTVALIAAVYLTITYVICPYRVTGNNMSPFVRDGDLCFFYKLEEVYLNDVVLYETQDGNYKVGRVVGVPGQEVNFPKDGGFEINGYQPSEEIPYETYASEQDQITFPLGLGEDEYFILNDFRSVTADSRESGPISRKRIQGKLLLMLRRRGF